MKKLLELRKRMKKKKPVFLRQDAQKKKRLGRGWRKPKGLHSKMRLRHKDKRAHPEPGFGSPREIRGLSKEGLQYVVVSNPKQVEEIKKEKQGIVISSSVGNRKRVMIIKKALELNINVLNMKEPKKFVDKIEKEIQQKAEEKKKKKEEKEKKGEEKKKKAEKKEKEEGKEQKLEETVTKEEEIKEEKKEMDKTLITTQ
ncbi:50S ribosomal protein L32e [Candidatus Woesearchaeota archaeon]|nr:50S ribosomal protein L32e [Candidatus Woesearchaeota archaeon]